MDLCDFWFSFFGKKGVAHASHDADIFLFSKPQCFGLVFGFLVVGHDLGWYRTQNQSKHVLLVIEGWWGKSVFDGRKMHAARV